MGASTTSAAPAAGVAIRASSADARRPSSSSCQVDLPDRDSAGGAAYLRRAETRRASREQQEAQACCVTLSCWSGHAGRRLVQASARRKEPEHFLVAGRRASPVQEPPWPRVVLGGVDSTVETRLPEPACHCPALWLVFMLTNTRIIVSAWYFSRQIALRISRDRNCWSSADLLA